MENTKRKCRIIAILLAIVTVTNQFNSFSIQAKKKYVKLDLEFAYYGNILNFFDSEAEKSVKIKVYLDNKKITKMVFGDERCFTGEISVGKHTLKVKRKGKVTKKKITVRDNSMGFNFYAAAYVYRYSKIIKKGKITLDEDGIGDTDIKYIDLGKFD